jgi:hypothetical protein
VLYGSSGCGFSAKSASLLERKQQHHCKIGTDLIGEAMQKSGTPFSGMTPQVFACPSAELLLEAAGAEPGALGATAHGAVCSRMCKVGRASVRHVGAGVAACVVVQWWWWWWLLPKQGNLTKIYVAARACCAGLCAPLCPCSHC